MPDILLLIGAVFVSFVALFFLAQGISETEKNYLELMWILFASVPALTSLLFAIKYRSTLTEQGPSSAINTWLKEAIIWLGVAYGLTLFASLMCPAVVDSFLGDNEWGLKSVFCGLGSVFGYFGSGFASLFLIGRIISLDLHVKVSDLLLTLWRSWWWVIIFPPLGIVTLRLLRVV